ncbi:DUF2059 domain-containing protein [Microvirga terrestris]|uniref:DUF2059 domain-containing protein n=1 Tax=Microvirga terrestris TaxID=2791024 RepID=A0ABS0HT48_9HYPH|nr:DUF2059 domain-containing protein [Microvirga terrestris]MBF9196370.1 DUF2059 domain-containing protein [Microvirga terrestris]
MPKALRTIVLASLLTWPLHAFSQALSVDEKVKYILEITDFQRVTNAAFEGFKPLMVNQLRRSSNKITPELAEHIANIAGDEINNMKPEFTAFVVDLYKKELTEEEIGAFYDFYRTPVGSRVGRKMTKFTENMIPQVQAFMTRQFLPKFQARLVRDERLRNALSP